MRLRPYQDDAVDDLRQAFAAGHRRLLLQAATGAGKTVIAAQIVKGATDKGRYVMFLAHRRELVNQSADKLEKFGVDHGIIMAGEFPYFAVDVQVASIDTFRARCINSNKLPIPNADVIVIDEAHRSLAPTYLQIMDMYPNAVVLGLTATPIRGDGKGLGHIYDHMVQCPSIRELIEQGHLVKPRHFIPTIPDLTGVRTIKGDYDPKQLEDAMMKRQLVGDILTHWHRLAGDRPTVVFASGVKHSMYLRDEFLRQGVNAAHIDGNTALTERTKIIDDLKVGKIQVVCNYAVLTEGFDEPSLAACILARPTKNLGLYLQMAGRVLRPCGKKKDTLIIDHSGNFYEHGYVDEDRDWVLEEGKALETDRETRQKKIDESKPICCVMCTAVYTGQLICPKCGHEPKPKGKYVETLHGDLVEARIDKRRRKAAKKKEFTMEEKRAWHSQLVHIARQRKKSKGWVSHTYKAKFGVWPKDMQHHWWEETCNLMTPTKEVQSYVRSRNIAYAKRMQKEKSYVQANN